MTEYTSEATVPAPVVTPEPWKPSFNPWLIAVAVMLATFMEVLDTTIVNVSLRHIAGNLAAGEDEATWVLTSYLVSNAIVLPASAWFSKFFGRKRFLMTCVVIFTLSSFLCGIATSLPILIFARVLQGVGGGALQPIANAVMLESFPPKKRGMAMAIYGLGVVVAPVIGPTLGGWITDNYSWRWVFYINVPIGIIALMMMSRFLEDPPYIKNAKPGRIDAIGFGLMALGLATLQIVLDKGQQDDWFEAAWIRWASVIAIAALVAFVIWELRAKDPIVNLRILHNRNFALGTMLITAMGIIAYAPMAILPQFLQGLLGYPAMNSGMALSPRGLGAMVGMPLVGLLISRVDSRALIATGFAMTAITCFLLGNLTLDVTGMHFVYPNVIQGIAMGLIFVPLTTTAMGTLKNEEIGNATGIFSLVRNIGAGVGISLVTTAVSRNTQAHQTTLAANFTQYNSVFQQKLQAMQHGLSLPQAYAAFNGMLVKQASLLAYVDTFRWMALGCLFCLPLVLLLKKAKSGGAIAAH
ncbi:MAG: DHA2 family efflux MFS transporter permease subunit [Acidobacteria bacterium]|nr:DHA2 family efflux MFS transporter permease subunit [Acidobacteriota bacterium]